MNVKEILEKCAHLNVNEQRSLEDDYLEPVILKNDLNAWDAILKEILGPQAKPAGMEPTQEHLSLTKKLGSINSNQILYKHDFTDKLMIAMLWPWSDGEYITLKIVSQKK